MDQPDFERAKQYALQVLEQELPATAYYHSIKHTRDDVLPAAERLAALEGVVGDDLLCLRTAACYHDLGHIKHHENHEEYSVGVAIQVLPGFGYYPGHIALISRLIMITKWPPQPQTLLEKIMADADMDSLGREDFLDTSLALRREQEARGVATTDAEWYRGQIDFLQAHHYFTEAAHNLRDAGKQRNFALMHRLLAEAQSS
jgi:hypothetical protein